MAGRLLSSLISNVLSRQVAGLSIHTAQKIVPSFNPLGRGQWLKLHTASLVANNIQPPTNGIPTVLQSCNLNRPLLQATSLNQVPVRTRIMYSRRTGGPRTVSAVVRRFFRLNNGMWIRTRAGRHKKLWKKNGRRIAALQQHVFCTQRQCWMLDRMVNRYYKIPKFYANDPYAPYHSKKNLPFYNYNKPKFLP